MRNVDRNVFGEHHAPHVIDLPSSLTSSFGGDDMRAILDGITAGEVDAYYVHLAEGQRGNQRSIDEFDHLVDSGAHPRDGDHPRHRVDPRPARPGSGRRGQAGVVAAEQPAALRRDHPRRRRARRRAAGRARRRLAAVAGRPSLLAEMKVARQELADQGHPISARSWWRW